MKKILLGILITLLLVNNLIVFAESDISVYVNDSPVDFDQKPIIENGRTLVPIRAVAEEMGANVTWDSNTKTAKITLDGKTAMLKVDINDMIFGTIANPDESKLIQLDVPPRIYNGRTLLPIRAVVESFGGSVEWIETAKRIYVTYEKGLGSYQKGIVTNNSFESEYFGLRFNLPSGYIMSTEKELLKLVDVAKNYANDEYIKNYDYSSANNVYEMMAVSLKNTNVIVLTEKIAFENITVEQYFDIVKENVAKIYPDFEFEFNDDIGSVDIAGQSYKKVIIIMSINGIKVNQEYYVRKIGDRMLSIAFSFTDENKDEKNTLLNAFKPY
jgi:hypothetical protein